MSGSASTSTTTHHETPSSSQTSALPPSTSTSPTLPHSPETQRQIAEARRALEASMTNIGTSLSASLQSRAQNLHANSKQLEKQQKDVVNATDGLRKENERLKKVVDEGSRRVKELGNVQNWAEMLERDFLVLQETVRLANGGGEDSDWTGSYTGSEWSGSEHGDEHEEGSGTAEHPKQVGAIPEPQANDAAQMHKPAATVDNEGDVLMKDSAPEDIKGKSVDKEVQTEASMTLNAPQHEELSRKQTQSSIESSADSVPEAGSALGA